MNSASRSSASLVISVAASASVRATSERRHAEHVGREARRQEGADELAGRHEHLAAEMAALLLRRELILEVDARRARLDHPLHQLEGVQRAAEAGLGVGDDREQVVDGIGLALRPLDPVGAHERVVQPLHHRRDAVRRVEALVGIDVRGEVAVRRDLPAGEVDRLQPGLRHLHRLAAGEGAERGDVVLLGEQPPELLGAVPGERVLDPERAAQPEHVLGRVVAVDPVPAVGLGPVAAELDGVLCSSGVHGASPPRRGAGFWLSPCPVRGYTTNRTSRSIR